MATRRTTSSPTTSGGQIHRTEAAERMYGTGSPQHRAALRRFGAPPERNSMATNSSAGPAAASTSRRASAASGSGTGNS